MHPTNASSKTNGRYRAETVKDHFKKHTYKETMHKDAVTTELAAYGSYFVEKEKEEENLLPTSNEKVFTALYWLCEFAHSKLNSLLQMLESLGVEEVTKSRKRLSKVLKGFISYYWKPNKNLFVE